jgi:hypothetical protein
MVSLCGTCLNGKELSNPHFLYIWCEAHKRVVRTLPEECDKYIDITIQTKLEGGKL